MPRRLLMVGLGMLALGSSVAMASRISSGGSGAGGGSGGIPPVAATVDLPVINNNTCVYQPVTVTGAATGDMVLASADFYMGDDIAIGNARVTAANTVELTACNVGTFVTTDPPSGTFRFKLER